MELFNFFELSHEAIDRKVEEPAGCEGEALFEVDFTQDAAHDSAYHCADRC